MTTGYQICHKPADEREDLKIVSYWTHAKRPFADFIKSVNLSTSKGTIAQGACDKIMDILHTDNESDSLSASDRKKQYRSKLEEMADAYFCEYCPFTIRRKNFVFMQSDSGAKASAMEFISNLLPWAPLVQKEYPSEYKKS